MGGKSLTPEEMEEIRDFYNEDRSHTYRVTMNKFEISSPTLKKCLDYNSEISENEEKLIEYIQYLLQLFNTVFAGSGVKDMDSVIEKSQEIQNFLINTYSNNGDKNG